eukprot:6212621-Pleurochrysis_carterae.AAC.6
MLYAGICIYINVAHPLRGPGSLHGAPLRPWRYERAARQRGACFEALYQTQNILTKQHTKHTAADDLQAENEPKELSSLHTKHDVK